MHLFSLLLAFKVTCRVQSHSSHCASFSSKLVDGIRFQVFEFVRESGSLVVTSTSSNRNQAVKRYHSQGRRLLSNLPTGENEVLDTKPESKPKASLGFLVGRFLSVKLFLFLANLWTAHQRSF